jgi:gamma-glutamyl phosphate reductase
MLPKLKKERVMKKEDLIAQLEGVKVLSTQVDIDKVIALIQQLETEKKSGLTQDLAEEIADRIERTLDYNSSDLVDTDSAEFELNYDNRIELSRADINVSDIMSHVIACIDEFVKEEEDEATEAFVQAILAADSNEADEEESEE